MLAFIVTFVLISLPFAITFLVPFVIQCLGRPVGWYLRRASEGRRHQLMAQMDLDSSDARGWSRASKEGGKPDLLQGSESWDGLVGFLHPFWWVAECCWDMGVVRTDCLIVTLAGVVKEFFGKPSETRKESIRERSALFTRVIMKLARLRCCHSSK